MQRVCAIIAILRIQWCVQTGRRKSYTHKRFRVKICRRIYLMNGHSYLVIKIRLRCISY